MFFASLTFFRVHVFCISALTLPLCFRRARPQVGHVRSPFRGARRICSNWFVEPELLLEGSLRYAAILGPPKGWHNKRESVHALWNVCLKQSGVFSVACHFNVVEVCAELYS